MQSGLVRIYRTLQRLNDVIGPVKRSGTCSRGIPFRRSAGRAIHDPFIEQFIDAMNEDLNTAGAIGLMFEKVREMNKLLDSCEGSVDEDPLTSLQMIVKTCFLRGGSWVCLERSCTVL